MERPPLAKNKLDNVNQSSTKKMALKSEKRVPVLNVSKATKWKSKACMRKFKTS